MAGFFSKASSFLNSQANQQAPSHGDKGDNEEETRKPGPASSGEYGDLLASAQSFMKSAKPNDDGESVDQDGQSHKAPAHPGGYGDLLESAQSFLATSKPSGGSESEGDQTGKAPSSGGYGDLLASAQEMMGSTKLSSSAEDQRKEVAPDVAKTAPSSGDSNYGDVYASAQVLMGAVKASREGGATDMGEVAGATADLIGAGRRYGNLEETPYGAYADKAQTYLQDYEASHGKAAQKPSSPEVASAAAPVRKVQEAPLADEEKQAVGTAPPLKNPMTTSSPDEGYN